MLDRRQFLAAAPAATAFLDPCRVGDVIASLAAVQGAPEQVAADESYWFKVQQAFTVDRTITNLNNGGVSPAPAVVQDSVKRHLDQAHTCPARVLWQDQEPRRETSRKGLAKLFGCSPDEVAMTRNSSEALQTCQFGLELKAGDEILTTTQDYGRMLTTWRQRERREGLVLKTIRIPIPCEDDAEIVRRFEAAITPKTRAILMCHVINLTGQVLPVRDVVRLARGKGIPVIVDGAHSFAHFPFEHKDLDCDYYGTSLHKWLFAPLGTGMLYVRREKIAGLWPLMAADEKSNDDIRKFEETGTRPAAPYLGIAEAVTFHLGIGPERKAARLRFLRDRWAKRLAGRDRVKLLTSLDPRFSCGLATFQVEGLESKDIASALWDDHRILVTAIGHDEVKGVRVTPSVYTTLAEIDRFSEALDGLIAKSGRK